jgi:aryl-alcohol dehydrogenase-like predicted oxidoreductase
MTVSGLSSEQKFIFGTMRLHELETDQAQNLLVHALEQGVRRFHVSVEYDSFEFFCEQIRIACQRVQVALNDLNFAAKLASPHFGEESISKQDIIAKIDHLRRGLGSDQIADIQWMARIDLSREDDRLELVRNSGSELTDIAAELKDLQLIKRFGCFPYTNEFAKLAVKVGAFDLMFDYLNHEERSPDLYQSEMVEQDCKLIAIRPFGAGKSLKAGTSPTEIIQQTLSSQSVEALVIGTHNQNHLDEILTAAYTL